jgi:hypothetical protein
MDRLKQATDDTRYAAWTSKADGARFRKPMPRDFQIPRVGK